MQTGELTEVAEVLPPWSEGLSNGPPGATGRLSDPLIRDLRGARNLSAPLTWNGPEEQ